jgi:hypothetical protein
VPTKANTRRWSLRRSDGSFPGPPPTGACCKNDGTCEILTEDECTALAGSSYKGDDIACGAAGYECDPTGACCTGTDCNQYTNAYCTELTGTYHGDGVDCADPSCPESTLCITTGSCCYYDTSLGRYDCFDCKTEQECTDLSDNGTLCDLAWTEGLDCDAANCNDIGRCCYHTSVWDSECTNNTATECTELDGHWDSNKACDACQTPILDTCPTGRCCVAADDGSYSECKSGVTEITCEVWGDLAGYQSNWVVDGVCDGTNPCGFGLCCDGGVCKGPVMPDQCTDILFGDDTSTCRTDCNECDNIACCEGENCNLKTECACIDGGGTSTGESDCGTDCNRCDLGVCCEGENCTLKNECECIDAGGDFLADESDCGTNCNRCITGACCNATSGSCDPNMNECDCIDSGVDWEFFPNEDCGPPLPCIPVGACCSENFINGWQCSVGTEAACLEKNNPTYLGDDTNCTPLGGNLARCTKMSCTNCIPQGCFCQAVPCPDPDACNDCCTSNGDCHGPC